MSEVKKFVCYWGDGYDEAVELHTEDWFTEDLGYDAESINQIQALEVGEVLPLIIIMSTSYILRVR